MRGNGEGQARGFDDRPRDAFSDTLKDEKDPVVRLYLENLRAQVATIAAKYGANARDVFRSDVQDRMGIEDFAKVAELVKAIGGFGEKKVGAGVRREMLEGFERFERRAEEMLERALGAGLMATKETAGHVLRWYVRAGLVDRAFTAVVRREIRLDFQVIRDVRLATAKAWALSKPVMSNDIFMEELEARRESSDFSNGMRNIVALFDAKYPLLSDPRFLRETRDIWEIADPLRPIAFERFLIELRRRGLDESTRPIVALRANVEKVIQTDPVILAKPMEYNLALAELRAANGMDASEEMTMAVDWFGSWVREMRPKQEDVIAKIRPIAWVAGKIGADGFLDRLEALAGARPQSGGLAVRMQATRGCIDAKNFDRALAKIRAEGTPDGRSTAVDLMYALLEDGQIERAERVCLEFAVTDLDALRGSSFSLAAHARRGENVLDLAETRAAELAIDMNGQAAQALANAAIATIGFTTAMKRRLGV